MADGAGRKHGGPREHEPRTSVLLQALAGEHNPERMSLEHALGALGARATGMTLLFFSLINFLPLPTGVGSLFAVPIVLFAWQMTLGQELWLPRFLRRQTLDRRQMARLVGWIVPWIRWVEKMSRPRLEFLTDRRALQFLGPFVGLLVLIVILPVPGTNFPPSVCLVIMALGIIERDGMAMIVGVVAGLAYLVAFIWIGDWVLDQLLQLFGLVEAAT